MQNRQFLIEKFSHIIANAKTYSPPLHKVAPLQTCLMQLQSGPAHTDLSRQDKLAVLRALALAFHAVNYKHPAIDTLDKMLIMLTPHLPSIYLLEKAGLLTDNNFGLITNFCLTQQRPRQAINIVIEILQILTHDKLLIQPIFDIIFVSNRPTKELAEKIAALHRIHALPPELIVALYKDPKHLVVIPLLNWLHKKPGILTPGIRLLICANASYAGELSALFSHLRQWKLPFDTEMVLLTCQMAPFASLLLKTLKQLHLLGVEIRPNYIALCHMAPHAQAVLDLATALYNENPQQNLLTQFNFDCFPRLIPHAKVVLTAIHVYNDWCTQLYFEHSPEPLTQSQFDAIVADPANALRIPKIEFKEKWIPTDGLNTNTNDEEIHTAFFRLRLNVTLFARWSRSSAFPLPKELCGQILDESETPAQLNTETIRTVTRPLRY